MNIPGFSAEASLGATQTAYQASVGDLAIEGVTPAMPINPIPCRFTSGCSRVKCMCNYNDGVWVSNPRQTCGGHCIYF